MLQKLCKEYTNLSELDILKLLEVEKTMQYMADLSDADIFIDCMARNGKHAIVVAEAKPRYNSSAYAQLVVGQIALREKEPAVFHTFESGTPVRDLKAITQENVSVKQDVVPILGEDDKVIAVLIKEKDISSYLLQDKKFNELARSVENRNNLLQSVDNRELILRETNHRVKNNLQMIASILNMQARASSIPEVKHVLRQNVSRVLSIAAIHDLLAVESDEDIVSLKTLLDKIRRSIQSILPESKKISITVEGDDISLPASRASAIALCINELITNAVTHAFVGRDTGDVVVNIQQGNLYSSITVIDNGIGFLPGCREKGSLGLGIVERTVKDKLQGEFIVTSGGEGTRARMELRL